MLRKIICVFVLLSLALSISACGGGNKGKAGDTQSYYYEETELGGDSGMIDPAGLRINSQNQLVFYDWGERGSLRYVTVNTDGKPAGNINVDISGDGSVFTLDDRDNLYIAAILGSSESEGEQKLYIVDKTGKIAKTVDLGKADLSNEKNVMPAGVRAIAIGSDGNIYLADPTKGIIVLDKDGNQAKTFGSQGAIKLAAGKDNAIYAGYSSKDGNYVEKLNASNGQSLWKLNIDNRKRYENMVYSSSDDNIYLLGEEGIERIDAAGKQPVTVLTFSDYTILGAGLFIPAIAVDSAKNIYAYSVTPPEGPKSGGKASDSASQAKVPYDIFKYTLKSGTNGNEGKKTITVSARRSERHLQTAVSLFQKNNPDFKVKLEYPDNSDRDNYINNLNTNIFAGKGPDILQTSWLPYDRYISKGYLVDLNELINEDKSFDASQYYTNILDGVKRKGHMYFMPVLFNFNALLANKGILDEAGITIDSSKWTWNDFKAAAERVIRKDDNGNVVRTALPNVSPLDLLNYFIVLGDFSKFVDPEKKIASFDSPDFMEMLELVKSFGDNNLTSKGNFKASYADVMEAAYRGAVVFMPQPMQGYIDYGVAKAMFNGKLSVLSFPSENGEASGTFSANETYGITSTSKYKDKAWEFIKVLISEEIQSNLQVGGFAVNKTAQKKLAERALEETSNGSVKIGMGDKDFSIGKLTQEDANYIDSMISGLNRYFSIDSQIAGIVMDEAAAFFSGDKSVEETAGLIQNRVNTYLNE